MVTDLFLQYSQKHILKEHMRAISCCLDQNIQKYDIILMGDYNAETTNASMQEFCES